MKFSIKDLFSKCDQIRSFLRIWPHLLKKSLMENFIFCAVYHPMINSSNKVTRDNKCLLNINEEFRKTFSPGPMVSFRSARKLSSYLVRAKLYPLQKEVDS